jgi:HK97 family phage major capsid protein
LDIDQFSTVEELDARLKEIKERLNALDAEAGVKELPEASRAEWQELNEEHDAIQARLEEKRIREDRIAELAEKEDNREAGGGVKPPARNGRTDRTADWTWDMGEIRMHARSEEDYRQRLRDTALHFVEGETFPGAEVRGVSEEKVRSHIQHLLDTIDAPDLETGKAGSEVARRILITGNPVYKRAFGKYLKGQGMSPEEQRALSVGTGSAGGFAVVYNLDPTIVPTSNFSVNPWRAMARIESIAGTNEWRAVTSGAITAAYGAEALEATDNAPTLAQPAIVAQKAQAFVPFSIEIGMDWPGLQSEMATLLQDSKDDLEATKFALGAGSGSTEPKGVITGATNTVGTTTTAAFVIADIYKLVEALPPRFRPRMQFAANLFIVNKIRQFDTSGGSGVWIGPQGLQAQAQAGGAGTTDPQINIPLLGKPVYEATAMGSVLTTTTKILIVGDFRYFVIVDRVGLNVEVVPHLFGTTANLPSGQRGLYAYWRNSSDVLSAAAFRVLVT